ALAEQAPQVGRILRPLCHILGVRAPAFLRQGGAGDCASPQLAAPPPHLASPPPGAESDSDDAGVVPPPPQVVAPPAPAFAPPPPALAPPPPLPSPVEGEGETRRPLSWLEEDAPAMRERVARWVARHADPPSTLLPAALSPRHAFPGTGPPPFSKNRG